MPEKLVMKRSAVGRLRKSLFGRLQAQPMQMHAPLPPHKPAPAAYHGPGHAGKVLMASKADPSVRRWQAVDNSREVPHREHARKLLGELHRAGGEVHLSRARAEHPEVRDLEHHGFVRLKPNPAHYMAEFHAELTDKGHSHMRAQRRQESEDLKQRQVGLLAKGAEDADAGFVELTKATPAAMLPGVQAPAPDVKTPKKVHFRHPETGEKRSGDVVSSGPEGIRVADHDGGEVHRIVHGSYLDAAHEKESGGKADGKPTRPARKQADKGHTPVQKKQDTSRSPKENEHPTDDDDREAGAETNGAPSPERKKLLEVAEDHLRHHPDSEQAVLAAGAMLSHHTPSPHRLKGKDVEVDGDTVIAGGKRQKHARLAGIVKHLKKRAAPDEHLLQHDDAAGDRHRVTRADLDRYTHANVSEKHDFSDVA